MRNRLGRRTGTPAGPAEADAAAPRLALRDIEHRIAGQPILRGVSLDVHPREIVCLLGPSGCGKTTLLRIAAGIERQDAGTVSVAGKLVAGPAVFVPAEARKLGLVFQDLALFPHMRVAENVAYGLTRNLKVGAKEKANDALAQVGLRGYGRAYPHQLSGGEQQRVALVRALLPGPKVVLFDEPFSGLDRSLRDHVRDDTLNLLREREATAVIVTHDPEEALAIADRIALMRDGAIVQTASAEEIWRWPVDLEAAKVFSHVNAFHARAQGGVVETPVGRVPVGGELDGEMLTIAFRPEALRVFPLDRGAGVEVAVTRRRFYGSHVEIEGRIGEVRLLLRADPYLVPHADSVAVVPDVRQAIVLAGRQ